MALLNFQKRLVTHISKKHNSECENMEFILSPKIEGEKRREVFFMNISNIKCIVKYGKDALCHELSEDKIVIDMFDFEDTPVLILKNI